MEHFMSVICIASVNILQQSKYLLKTIKKFEIIIMSMLLSGENLSIIGRDLQIDLDQ